jgi:hypothetical protein
MHRSGSSLTSNLFSRSGLSLGPFELMAASPSNRYGHFEAMPFYELNRKIQASFHGFPDDMPLSQDRLRRFVAAQGAWDDAQAIPEDWITEGRHLVASLLASGEVSGFKDPRTILLWPFWQRVLTAFPDVRVVPVVLLRSPHEIAMSLCARSDGEYSYLACLDVVAVHLRRLRQIVEEWNTSIPVIRFGTAAYLSDMAEAVRACGLEWDDAVVRAHIDETCIHHAPARVAHEAQSHHDALAGPTVDSTDIATNQERLIADERSRETLVGRRLAWYAARAEYAEGRVGQLQAQLEAAIEETRAIRAQAQDQLRSLEEQLARSRGEVAELLRRLARFETHGLFGPILRGRRRVKAMLATIRPRAAI